jgi:hypothetical protein
MDQGESRDLLEYLFSVKYIRPTWLNHIDDGWCAWLECGKSSVQLAKLFQSRRFLEINQSETRIACALLLDRDEMSNLLRGPLKIFSETA